MQSYISVNTAEIVMRDAVRNELQSKMDEFLKSNEITVLRLAQRPAQIAPHITLRLVYRQQEPSK